MSRTTQLLFSFDKWRDIAYIQDVGYVCPLLKREKITRLRDVNNFTHEGSKFKKQTFHFRIHCLPLFKLIIFKFNRKIYLKLP